MNIIRRIGLRNLVQIGFNQSRPILANGAWKYSSKAAKIEEAPNPKLQQYKDPKKANPKITVINTDESVLVVNLEEAQHMAKRRNLKLVHVMDADIKTVRAVYK
jgi:translation initiation factor IF-3